MNKANTLRSMAQEIVWAQWNGADSQGNMTCPFCSRDVVWSETPGAVEPEAHDGTCIVLVAAHILGLI